MDTTSRARARQEPAGLTKQGELWIGPDGYAAPRWDAPDAWPAGDDDDEIDLVEPSGLPNATDRAWWAAQESRYPATRHESFDPDVPPMEPRSEEDWLEYRRYCEWRDMLDEERKYSDQDIINVQGSAG